MSMKLEYEKQSLIWFFLSFKGRITRKEYVLKYLIPIIIISLFFYKQGKSSLEDLGYSSDQLFDFMPYFITLYFGIYFWIKFAVGAKRLHDCQISGWWQAAPVVLSIFVKIYLEAKGVLLSPIALIPVLAELILLLNLLFRKGTDGPNRFGPDPLKPMPLSNDDDMGSGAADIQIEPVGAGE